MAAASSPFSQSTCATEKVQGFHRFVISNYCSRIRGLVTGRFVRSGTFTVGGYDWSVLFFPSGCHRVPKGSTSVYLQLMTKGVTARAAFAVRLVNPTSGRSRSSRQAGIGLYNNTARADAMIGIEQATMAELEETFVSREDGTLIIELTVSVLGEPRASATARIPAPPHLRRLLESQGRADVAFDVQGQRFAAHRMVLAMRSPVFEAQLFGPMNERDGRCVTIQGVHPAVFKLLLDVIYTDAFPAMDDQDEDTNRELARHLLAAADRYGMDRLKAQCEGVLSTSLNAETVASTLALADRHSCRRLKDACVEFIITLGINNDSLARMEDDRQGQLGCFAFLKCFWNAIGSLLKIH